MQILFVASEIAPYTSRSPRAQALAALPKALRGLGHDVTFLAPLLSGVDPRERALARRLSKVEVSVGGETIACEIYDGRTAGGIDLVFVGHPELFARARDLREGDARTVATRALVLARAAAQVVRSHDGGFALVHAHDWEGALAIAAAQASEGAKQLPSVLTVHDPRAKGVFEARDAEALGLSADTARAARHDGGVSALLAGLVRADQVAVTSPTLARSLLVEPGGHGLAAAWTALGDKLVGIRDGVDASIWNPATDAKLAHRYDPMDLAGKLRDKAHLQRALELPVRDDVPLVAVLGRPGPAHGLDLFAKAATKILRNDCQVAVVFDGTPEDDSFQHLAGLSERWSDRLRTRHAGDGSLAHEALAAADLVLVPAREDVGDPTAMIAHRYGALPIALRVGAVADAMVDCDAELVSGSGFLYDAPTEDELLAAVRRAVGAFTRTVAFRKLAAQTMRIDHSWERSARLYERAYRAAITPGNS